jgi:hypothetical protein
MDKPQEDHLYTAVTKGMTPGVYILFLHYCNFEITRPNHWSHEFHKHLKSLNIKPSSIPTPKSLKQYAYRFKWKELKEELRATGDVQPALIAAQEKEQDIVKTVDPFRKNLETATAMPIELVSHLARRTYEVSVNSLALINGASITAKSLIDMIKCCRELFELEAKLKESSELDQRRIEAMLAEKAPHEKQESHAYDMPLNEMGILIKQTQKHGMQ